MLFLAKPSLMKPVYSVLLAALCSSCVTYQYATVDSPLKKDDSDLLVVETDTVTITYDFRGEDGPVKIAIFNKLNQPLYVDWSKSALIVENLRRSYATNQATLEGSANGSEMKVSRSYSTQDVGFKGVITSRESVSFIPPRSLVNEQQLNLSPNLIAPATAGSRYHTEKIKGVNVKSYYYNQISSPFRFRSFLTLSFKEDMSDPIYFDHSFWISKIDETELTPSDFSDQSNQFYVVKKLVQ